MKELDEGKLHNSDFADSDNVNESKVHIPDFEGAEQQTTGIAHPSGQTPLSGLCQPDNSEDPPASLAASKLPASIIVPIHTIFYDSSTLVDTELKQRIQQSIDFGCGKLMIPLLVSKLPIPHDGKLWLLHGGRHRLDVAIETGLPAIRVIVLEGTEEQIRLQVHEIEMVRRHPTPYQTNKQMAEFHDLLQHVYPTYKAGGNKATMAAYKEANNLPPLKELIEKVTGYSPSTFFEKVHNHKKIAPVVGKYLDKNPHCATAQKDRYMGELARLSHEEQNKAFPLLRDLPSPREAHSQAIREEAMKKAKSLPDDGLFPIYHEPFWENAKRIDDGSVMLVPTDPNWKLAENSEKGKIYSEHGIPIARVLTEDEWHEFGKLLAQKLSPDGGHAAILMGQQHMPKIAAILGQYLTYRWVHCYLHASGRGTTAHNAAIASHWRPLLVYQRKDAKPKKDIYKEFIHDVIPNIPKDVITFDDVLLDMLKSERKLLDLRIAELEAGKDDPFMNDVITTYVRQSEILKMWGPWTQDPFAFVKVMRQLSKAGDFIWEPFAGSGTTAIAAVTCTDRHSGEREMG
ncbi:MAG: hypothetical protein ABSG11_22240 [Candidatus Korobacteraceae bacterium]|jgi:hypothetical protein